MPHTKFRENLPAISGEEDILRFLRIYGHDDNLGHVTSILLINFHFLVPEK